MNRMSPNRTCALVALLPVFLAYVPVVAAQTGGVSFVSPADGQVVQPGESVPVVLSVDEGLGATIVGIVPGFTSDPSALDPMNPPYETTIAMPVSTIGPVKLAAYADDLSDPSTVLAFAEITLNVVPEGSPLEMKVAESNMLLMLPSSPHEGIRTIHVTGRYADGRWHPIREFGLGTTFDSDSPAVATVSADGVVTPLSEG